MCCKTDSCFIDGAQFGGLVDRPSGRLMPWEFIMGYFSRGAGDKLTPGGLQERIDRTFANYKRGTMNPESRYRQVKCTVSSANNRKYLKLYNGDIYCVETNTILNRHTLLELMENLQ